MAYDLKNEDEIKEYIENLGIEYRFSCYHEKNRDGCHLLGDYLEAIKKDFCKAAIVYKSNCDDYNLGKSCFKYAEYRHVGKGCKMDKEIAYDYFVKGCQYDHRDSCFLAGVMLTASGNRQKDYLQGLKFLEKGCNDNSANSCYFASGLFIKGNEQIPRNMTTAFEYSTKACNLGHPQACANLSQMYLKGEGTDQNAELAKKFQKIAKEIQNQHLKQFHQIKFGES